MDKPVAYTTTTVDIRRLSDGNSVALPTEWRVILLKIPVLSKKFRRLTNTVNLTDSYLGVT